MARLWQNNTLMISCLVYCDSIWTIICLLMVTTISFSELEQNIKEYDTKLIKPSTGCRPKKPIKVPIQDMQKVIDELLKVEENVFGDIHFLSDNPKRYKYYYVDIVAIADYPIYQYFMDRYNNSVLEARSEIQKHLAFIIFGTKRLYLGNEFSMMGMYNYKIVLNLVDIIIIDSPEKSFLNEIVESDKFVDSVSGLNHIRDYLFSNRVDESFDHIAYFTDYTLYDTEKTNTVLGVAWIGTMCRINEERSVSLIFDDFTAQPMLTFAHELGHSLGAVHDGSENECSADDMFVMQAGDHINTHKTLNRWIFSNCSKNEISAYLFSKVKANATEKICDCFQNKIPIRKSVPDVSQRFHGSDIDLTAQCRIQGHGPPDACQKYRRSCSMMFCSDPYNNWDCHSILPLRGTRCGDGKVCEAGHCHYINQLRLLKTNFSSKLTAPCGSHCLQVCVWNLVLVMLVIFEILAG